MANCQNNMRYGRQMNNSNGCNSMPARNNGYRSMPSDNNNGCRNNIPESRNHECRKMPDNCNHESRKMPDNCNHECRKMPDNCNHESRKMPDNCNHVSRKMPDNCNHESRKMPDNCNHECRKMPDNCNSGRRTMPAENGTCRPAPAPMPKADCQRRKPEPCGCHKPEPPKNDCMTRPHSCMEARTPECGMPKKKTTETCGCRYDALEDFPLAMAYVPWQKWRDLFEPCKALQCGTIFEELFKPFKGRGGCNR